jgi:hypothetical protein
MGGSWACPSVIVAEPTAPEPSGMGGCPWRSVGGEQAGVRRREGARPRVGERGAIIESTATFPSTSLLLEDPDHSDLCKTAHRHDAAERVGPDRFDPAPAAVVGHPSMAASAFAVA